MLPESEVFASQAQRLTINIVSQSETRLPQLIEQGLHKRNQASAFAFQQYTYHTNHFKSQAFCQKSRQTIIKSCQTMTMKPCVGNHGALSGAQAVGRQFLYLFLRHLNQRGPGKLAWIHSVCSQQSSHVELQHYLHGHKRGLK